VHENILFGQTALTTLNLSDEEMEGMKKEAMTSFIDARSMSYFRTES